MILSDGLRRDQTSYLSGRRRVPKRSTAKDNEVPDSEANGHIDPLVYNAIARCAKLLSIQLIESNFTISPNFFDKKEVSKLNLDFVDEHGSFDEDTRITTCIFALEAHKKVKRTKVFSVKDKYVVFYKIESDCDEHHAVSFARKVGLMACYPYFRSHVANTAAMANADMPILPTISTMPVRQLKEKEKAK